MNAEHRKLVEPQISIVIPAHNEEHHLSGCLESIEIAASRAQLAYEVVVVLNRCTDATEEIAHEAGCKTVVDESKNLSMIRNAGVSVARAPVIVTIDADSRFSPDYLTRVMKAMENEAVVGGGTLRIVPDRMSLGILLTGMMLLPIALYYRISGGAFFFRRSAYTAVGGFDEEKTSAEDIFFARSLQRYAREQNKKYINFIGPHIRTSARKFDHFGDWYFLKNPGLFFRLLKGRDREGADLVWYDFRRHEKKK